MADFANVHSLERLQDYLEQAKHYRTHILREVENLQVELRKLTRWIENDATQYWQSELQLSRRKLSEAQDALTRCMSYVREEERKPCSEEKKRVYRAQARRATCEEKLRLAMAAAKAWSREFTKNSAKVQRVHELGDADLTVMIHHLESQIETLEKYATLRTTAVSNTPESKAPQDTSDEPQTPSETPSPKSEAP